MSGVCEFGDSADPAGAIVYPADAQQFGPYGEEPRQVWQRLEAAAVNGSVNLESSQITDIVGPPQDTAEGG